MVKNKDIIEIEFETLCCEWKFEILMSVGKQLLLACYRAGDCETENNYFRVF